MLSSLVLQNGLLDDQKIWKKETIYQGTNGKSVERFYLSPKKSYIFKPLTNETQIGKEAWIQENILIDFPDIYPKILAKSQNEDPSRSWLILEDIGSLQHVFNEESVRAVIKWMAWWHQYPTEGLVSFPLMGHKPSINTIIAEIQLKKEKVFKLTRSLAIQHSLIEKIYENLQMNLFSNQLVLSHGDLHLGNYGLVENQIYILDWEHAHLNLPFWDLYHMLDLAHPDFPRTMSHDARNYFLDYYLKIRNDSGSHLDVHSFKRNYHLFSSAFSIWMLLLIQNDLEKNEGKWTVEQLQRELSETIITIIQCGEELQRLTNG